MSLCIRYYLHICRHEACIAFDPQTSAVTALRTPALRAKHVRSFSVKASATPLAKVTKKVYFDIGARISSPRVRACLVVVGLKSIARTSPTVWGVSRHVHSASCGQLQSLPRASDPPASSSVVPFTALS